MMKKVLFLAASIYCMSNVGVIAQDHSMAATGSEGAPVEVVVGKESGSKRAMMAKGALKLSDRASDAKQSAKEKWNAGKEKVGGWKDSAKEKVMGSQYDAQ